jgi:Ribosomal_S17 N-terminal
MATELTVQSERAFQKQPHIFVNPKTRVKSKRVGKGGRRWYKDVGLGFRTPKTAIEGSYIGMDVHSWNISSRESNLKLPRSPDGLNVGQRRLQRINSDGKH